MSHYVNRYWSRRKDVGGVSRPRPGWESNGEHRWDVPAWFIDEAIIARKEGNEEKVKDLMDELLTLAEYK